jgi:hypothetical protein
LQVFFHEKENRSTRSTLDNIKPEWKINH